MPPKVRGFDTLGLHLLSKKGVPMQWLLVTDLDNTLVGDDDALQTLNRRLEIARSQEHIVLVYSTGRSLTSYRQLCKTVPLLPPDILITSVGTEIYEGNSDRPDAQWSGQLQPQWDHGLATQIASRFDALQPQSNTEQRPFKLSYFLQEAIAAQVMTQLSEALQKEGVSAQLVYSGGIDLDILPQAANKGKAMQFVQAQLGIPEPKTVACGDSGNDIALFTGEENRGVIVGNAQPELLDWHAQTPSPYRYLARSSYAAGILEGLHYFGVGI
jgi:sucrose-6-phosphatase